ncbi:hypothetical protein F4818DRAFT_445264 [Hypoxylon cercidicola]|nr:hypothetical protein F4818DRAFT_445264 [Hypoxylon cercidicola]
MGVPYCMRLLRLVNDLSRRPWEQTTTLSEDITPLRAILEEREGLNLCLKYKCKVRHPQTPVTLDDKDDSPSTQNDSAFSKEIAGSRYITRLITEDKCRIIKEVLNRIFGQNDRQTHIQILAQEPLAIHPIPIVVESYARQAMQIVLGLHPVKFFLGATGVFPSFVKLPTELLGIIWDFAIQGESRAVLATKFKKIMRAHCPVLFLIRQLG